MYYLNEKRKFIYWLCLTFLTEKVEIGHNTFVNRKMFFNIKRKNKTKKEKVNKWSKNLESKINLKKIRVHYCFYLSTSFMKI